MWGIKIFNMERSGDTIVFQYSFEWRIYSLTDPVKSVKVSMGFTEIFFTKAESILTLMSEFYVPFQKSRISFTYLSCSQVAHYLTLLLTTSSIFLSAWTILGPIAAPGGTVFALLVLIVLALLGGQIIKIFGSILSKLFRVNISLPPLLGTPVRNPSFSFSPLTSTCQTNFLFNPNFSFSNFT